MLGLRCREGFPLVGESRGSSSVVVWVPIAAASLVAEQGLQACRLSSCGARAELLPGIWNLPGSGIEPVSPALASRFFTTEPPGKPHINLF